jgi:beta-N-acetylhexosaminidase
MPMVMVAHARYPLTADPRRPATVSKFWMQAVLRKRIGYRGIVVSDDLEMGGVTTFMPIAEAAVATVRMGADLALICHHPEPILQTYEALLHEAERSAAFSKILIQRSRESARKRVKTFPAKMPAALSAKQIEALRARILRFGETVAKTAALEIP